MAKTERQKILIVDDQEANLVALAHTLRKIDAEVIQSNSGQAALEQILRHQFAVILLDVRMPGMDGYEVAEHLNGSYTDSKTPIIFITAEYPDEEHINKGYDAGAIDYLLKPFSPKSLISKVKILLEIDQHKKDLENNRDQLEEMLREREKQQIERERLMFAISMAGTMIVATDEDGKIEYVNQAYERITGYESHEMLGKRAHVFKEEKGNEKQLKEVWDALRKNSIWRGRRVNTKKDGSSYTLDVVVAAVKDPVKGDEHYVIIMHDVTKALEMETHIQRSQKIESVGQLVGGVAHDFNNLLQVINGYTEFAQMKMEPDHPSAESLEEVANAGSRGKKLVSQLLAFSRQQVIHPDYVDLNQEISNSRKMLARLIGKHIDLEIHTEDNLDAIYIDSGQLHQILMNLSINARDAMQDGGTLTFSTQDVTLTADDVLVHAGKPLKQERYALLQVKDTGCGIPEELSEKVFMPFFTTKEKGRGTGLGLSTVYGIVKQNKGYITFDSKPDEGTTFSIYFPISTPPSAAGTVENPKETALDLLRGTETILVADDEEPLRELAKYCLQAMGYNVLTARDGEQLVQVFKEHEDEVDLVLTDVVMPRMGGKQAMDQILKIRPEMPCLFVSGYSLDADRNDFIREEKLNLLTKPYENIELLKTVRKLLDQAATK